MTGYDDKCVIDTSVLSKYIPREEPNLLPATTAQQKEFSDNPGEREAIIRMLLQLKQDVDYLKDVIAKAGLARTSAPAIVAPEMGVPEELAMDEDPEEQDFEDGAPEDLSIRTANLDLIEKVLRKHGGNRKAAAAELGISERTLYRKIKNIK